MTPMLGRARRGVVHVLTVAVLSGLTVATTLVAGPAQAAPAYGPVDDYARYQPQRRCARKPKPGTLAVASWVVAHGGAMGGTIRRCRVGGTSEHKDGRAFDWTLDATDPADAAVADAVLAELFAPEESGEPNALARRMGIMYVIWDDRSYSAWREFSPVRYKSSSCRRLKKCSPTLRHRDHMHVSLSRKGARERTSWYAFQG